MQKTTLDQQQDLLASSSSTAAKPKLGFLGVGWIGRNRMEMIARHGVGEVSYIADTAPQNAEEALKSTPAAKQVSSLEGMLQKPEVSGIVIATPSAFHAEQRRETGLAAEGNAVIAAIPNERVVA